MLLVAAAKASNYWWYVGFGISFTVIVIVVLQVSMILSLAAKINRQAREGIAGLDTARMSTLPLWDLRETNATLRSILEAARAARRGLGG
jgi:hypothetical protein